MPNNDAHILIRKLADGRTDLVYDLVELGHTPEYLEHEGVSILRWCAYFGDVSALRFLLARGASLSSLGTNFDLDGAVFHGYWRFCQFLLESGADANLANPVTGETPLHIALSKTDRITYDRVVRVLLAHGANPNVRTHPGEKTGCFMRDCRTKGETPLHRAAAFGDETTIQLLLDAGALVDARDSFGDTSLNWASWYGRPNPILRPLLYGNFRIHPANRTMQANLLGDPNVTNDI